MSATSAGVAASAQIASSASPPSARRRSVAQALSPGAQHVHRKAAGQQAAERRVHLGGHGHALDQPRVEGGELHVVR